MPTVVKPTTQPGIRQLVADTEEAVVLLRTIRTAGIDVTRCSTAIHLHGFSASDLARIARLMGKINKRHGDQFYWIERKFGAARIVAFPENREEICERTVVGTRRVPEEVIPAHDEEIVRWKCRPLLGFDQS